MLFTRLTSSLPLPWPPIKRGIVAQHVKKKVHRCTTSCAVIYPFIGTLPVVLAHGRPATTTGTRLPVVLIENAPRLPLLRRESGFTAFEVNRLPDSEEWLFTMRTRKENALKFLVELTSLWRRWCRQFGSCDWSLPRKFFYHNLNN